MGEGGGGGGVQAVRGTFVFGKGTIYHYCIYGYHMNTIWLYILVIEHSFLVKLTKYQESETKSIRTYI